MAGQKKKMREGEQEKRRKLYNKWGKITSFAI